MDEPSPDREIALAFPAEPPSTSTANASPTSNRSTSSRLLDFANNAIESAALRDGIKLIILGGALEAARRGCGLIAQQVFEREYLRVKGDPWRDAYPSSSSTQSSPSMPCSSTLISHTTGCSPGYRPNRTNRQHAVSRCPYTAPIRARSGAMPRAPATVSPFCPVRTESGGVPLRAG